MNENNELTAQEKALLKAIIQDKFSIGAFSGMIYNSIVNVDDWSNENIALKTKLALKIRLLLVELSE